MAGRVRGWIVDVAVGGGIGMVLGTVVALNTIIFFGTDAGYTATPGELFAQRPVAAVLALSLQVAGPVAGIAFARRLRRDRLGR